MSTCHIGVQLILQGAHTSKRVYVGQTNLGLHTKYYLFVFFLLFSNPTNLSSVEAFINDTKSSATWILDFPPFPGKAAGQSEGHEGRRGKDGRQ